MWKFLWIVSHELVVSNRWRFVHLSCFDCQKNTKVFIRNRRIYKKCTNIDGFFSKLYEDNWNQYQGKKNQIDILSKKKKKR